MGPDFETSLAGIPETPNLPAEGDVLTTFSDTVFTFSREALRDLKVNDWQNQYQGGLNAGYLLCLAGRVEEGVQLMRRSLEMFTANRREYSSSESSVVQFVISTLQEFGADEELVSEFEDQLAVAKAKEIDTPDDLQRKIAHAEADMECAEGDLDDAYSAGRKEQGECYLALGEFEPGLAAFRGSIEYDDDDLRSGSGIQNRLALVDCHLGLEDRDAALTEFMELMKLLEMTDVTMGAQLPDLFLRNFDTLLPYLKKLNLEDSISLIVQHLEAYLEAVVPAETKNDWDVIRPTQILGEYYVGTGEYAKACKLYDSSREKIGKGTHLSRREHADLALRTGDPEKARRLISEDDDDPSVRKHEAEYLFQTVGLELQLGNITGALERLDRHCEAHKANLIRGTYSMVYDLRRSQIAILKEVLGDDYLPQVRAKIAEAETAFFGEEPKFIEGPTAGGG